MKKSLYFPGELVEKIVKYLIGHCPADNVEYYNRYGSEQPEIDLCVTLDQVAWCYSQPSEIIQGYIKLANRVATLSIMEELAKIIVRGISGHARMNHEMTAHSVATKNLRVFGFSMKQESVAVKFSHVGILCALGQMTFNEERQDLFSLVLNIQSSSGS